MRQIKISLSLLAMVALVATVGCGGGGNGFEASNANALGVANADLPTLLSGQSFGDIGMPQDYEIPLVGGCGGPYVIAVISGDLPPGISTDVSVPATGPTAGEPRHHLIGLALENGNYSFRLQITDTACVPFSTTTQDYVWTIGEGPLKIVGASPALIPEAEYADADPARPGIDALETTVYGSLVAIDLIAAGGVPPYVCNVINDQDDPLDDAGLPQGVSFAIDSSSMVGSPSQVGPGGKPFLITFSVRDFVGNTATRKLWWKIDTPPIIIANPTIADGTNGAAYSDAFQIVDGVPPFNFELVDALPGPDADGNDYSDIDWTVSPPAINSIDPISVGGSFTLASTGPASNKLDPANPAMTYPPTNFAGPYKPYPSEGLYLVDGTIGGGSFTGMPRRAGTFTIFVHAFSTLVPNNRGQHAFKAFTHSIAVAPPVSINLAFCEEIASPIDGFPTLQEAEQDVIYNPDAVSDLDFGLKFLANGGVKEDGYFDAPHDSQRLPNPGEIADAYGWTANMLDQVAPFNVIEGLSMFSTDGHFGNAPILGDDGQANSEAMVKGSRRVFSAMVTDQQLPDSLNTPASSNFGISIGPDTVIITQSTRSNTSTYPYYRNAGAYAWDDHYQRVRKFKGGASPGIFDLADSDMAKTHVMPSAAGSVTLGGLLSGSGGLDLLRGIVNPTGWWDNKNNVGAHGAQAGQHGDFNRDGPFYSHAAMYNNGGRYVISSGYGYGNWQPNATCIAIPDVEGVTHDPSAGIYADGGRLYHFESSTHYGIFIIRPDGKIYVPFASTKSTTHAGFGDGSTEVRRTPPVNSMFRSCHMTVSPDGRFGAMKILKDKRNIYETATSTSILLISLSGEKVFDGGTTTYKVIGNGASTTGSGNRIQYAASMALTNDNLYFLIGSKSPPNGTSTSVSYLYNQAWSGHFIMRYTVLSGATSAAKLTSPTADSQWSQSASASTTMQTVYQYHGPNTVSTSTGVGLRVNSTTYSYIPHPRYFGGDGMSMHENSLAPSPFRVSRDGSTVAFFAASDTTSTSTSLMYSNYCWVDRGDGARRVTNTRRRHMTGSSRAYTLFDGPWEYGSNAWGRYSGPTPGVEISDDGSQVAFVFNSNNSTLYGSDSYSSARQRYYRDSIILTSTTNNWVGYTERDICSATFRGYMSNSSSSSSVYYTKWRFGGLAFTQDGTGLAFWAGGGNYYPGSTSYTYQSSYVYAGTYFMHNVSDYSGSIGTKVTTMCGTSQGGFGTAGTSYTNTSPRQAGSLGINYTRFGSIHPWGGFMSRNRKFLYIVNYVSSSSSEATGGKLIGMNIQSAGAGSYAGKTNARAFIPASWPARRAFMPGMPYVYYGRYYPYYYGYGGGHAGAGCQVMAKDTGWVFWSSNNQYNGPSRSTSSNYAAQPHSMYGYGCYNYGGSMVMGFNADTGGRVAQLDPTGMSATGSSRTPYEGMDYLEVGRDGSKLLFVTSYGNTSYLYKSRERVNYVTNINFNGTNGAMHSGFNRTNDSGRLQASDGRASEALCFSTTSGRAYYAYKASASNETAMEMVEAKWDPSTKTWDKTAHASISGRIHVLYAIR